MTTAKTLAELTVENSSFSRLLPGMQVAIDSTSLGEAKLCMRRYFYAIICGWQSPEENVHFAFGILIHKAAELYWTRRFAGDEHQAALRAVVHDTLKATWNSRLKRPWISGDASKNRLTLLRTIVLYFDKYQNDPLKTLILASGKPALELSFRFASGFKVFNTGEPIMICGRLDRLASMHNQNFIADIKTTGRPVDAGWFSKFSPDNQFSTYNTAGAVAFATKIDGLIVDGIQVTKDKNTFQRGVVTRTPSQLAEWHHDFGRWAKNLETCAIEAQSLKPEAAEAAWYQNDKACHGCPFRPVCARPPEARAAYLQANYRRRVWDPLQRRGDV